MQSITQTLFITGTDTDVGKTMITGLLLDFLMKKGLKANYQKWVSAGGMEEEGDLEQCLAFCETPPPGIDLDLQVPFRFLAPVSPHLAAELEGIPPADPDIIKSRCRYLAASQDILLVEGAGGLLVPLRRDLLLADLIAEMGLPLLIVARSGLGTINHTLLSVEAARRRSIPIKGVVFSDGNKVVGDEALVRDNMRTIEALGKIPVFGRLPHCADVAMARQVFLPIGERILKALHHSHE